MQRPTFLIITRHDQRTRRRANMHFIADELAKRGRVHMFSFAFSWLSRLKKEQRVELWNRANRTETHEQVECYLWRTVLHPVNLRKGFLRPLERLFFKLYTACTPAIFKQWACESDVILFESGFPIMLIRLCHQLNPKAKLIYIASDSLHTIDCAQTIIEEFAATAKLFHHAIIPSRLLRDEMPAGTSCYFVPHGLDTSLTAHKDPSPYAGGVNIVSVGSMLFDASFFTLAADAFPDIHFHIIGGGAEAEGLSAQNITVYDEMPFYQTIPYLAHAQAGVAPYKGDKVAPFLVDTSMKLMQYGFLGIPALCPTMLVGDYAGRFGYIPGDKASIITAIRTALRTRNLASVSALSWAEVTQRILTPKD